MLLLEAGPDYATRRMQTPDDLRDSWRMSLRAHDWGLTAEAVPGRAIPYPRGRVIGGSSAVNAAIALRGRAGGLRRVGGAGQHGLELGEGVALLLQLESDPEAGEARPRPRAAPSRFVAGGPDELIPSSAPSSRPAGAGASLRSPITTTRRPPASAPSRRTGAGACASRPRSAYLPAARSRPNLTIRPHWLVSRVLFDGRRRGRSGSRGGRRSVNRLAGGASRCRRRDRRAGDPPTLGHRAQGSAAPPWASSLADLPGVGADLIDHPVTRLLLVPKPGSCDPHAPLAQVVLRYTAPGSDEFNDMQLVIFSHVDVAGVGGERPSHRSARRWRSGYPCAGTAAHAAAGCRS